MHRKDQIKAITAVVLFGIIGLSYYVRGKDEFTKNLVLIAALIWVALMIYFRRKNKHT